MLRLLYLAPCAGLVGYTHGVMSSTHARQVAHRYMPEVLNLPHVHEPLIVDTEAFNRYIRARIEFEPTRSFGVVSQSRDGKMTLFVLHGHDDNDVVRAVLWGTNDDAERWNELRTLALWHNRRFERRLTAELANDDLRLWRRAME